jgi:glycoside/pentoside/hexuronide:cation symporter, GPH family
MFSIISSSMVADLVEENQKHTQKRSEGTLFALRIFTGKAVSGLGIFLSGLVLALVGFPTSGAQNHVPQTVLNHLAMAYAPIFILLGVASAGAMLGYRITRAGHARNVAVVGGLIQPSP